MDLYIFYILLFITFYCVTDIVQKIIDIFFWVKYKKNKKEVIGYFFDCLQVVLGIIAIVMFLFILSTGKIKALSVFDAMHMCKLHIFILFTAIFNLVFNLLISVICKKYAASKQIADLN